MIRIFLFGFAVITILSCQGSLHDYSKQEKEIKAFLDNYARLLQNAKFDSVALLYVDSGFISSGYGQINVQGIDSIKASYSRLPKITNDFRWENTRIKLLSQDAALVTSLFYWHDKDSPDTTKTSYSGVYLKSNTGWKIMHEHESLDLEVLRKMFKQSDQGQ